MSNLADKVDAMLVGPMEAAQQSPGQSSHDMSKPIIQFPDEDGQQPEDQQERYVHVGMTMEMLEQMHRLQAQQGSVLAGSSWGTGLRPDEMIPALQGLSNL